MQYRYNPCKQPTENSTKRKLKPCGPDLRNSQQSIPTGSQSFTAFLTNAKTAHLLKLQKRESSFFRSLPSMPAFAVGSLFNLNQQAKMNPSNIIQFPSQTEAPKTIKAGETLTARSACDYDCIFEVEILERRGQFVKFERHGQQCRVKVFKDDNGNEFIYAFGRYSMAPIFKAI